MKIPFFRRFYHGAILTGDQIIQETCKKTISISSFELGYVGINSYDIIIDNYYLTYKQQVFDLHDSHPYEVDKHLIPNTGLHLIPGELYLIPTHSKFYTDRYVPMITGRSSIGRIGLSAHQEAGFGDIGFNGVWTLQVSPIYEVIIYPYDKIAQVYFLRPYGKIKKLYNGHYQNLNMASGSKFNV